VNPLSDPRALPLAVEKAVELEVNGERLATVMCTPIDLDVFAVGHLFTAGLIGSYEDIRELSLEPRSGCIRVRCTRSSPPARSLPQGDTFPLETIRGWVRQMFDRASSRREAGGGMHSAGLADRSGLRFSYEDVGRHNAVDKVIGRGLVDRVDFSRCCLVTSGRVALEIAAKICAAGIPIAASRSIPTTAAYELAVEKGLTVIGRIVSDSPIVYTRADRLV
jgi:FdhD protein